MCAHVCARVCLPFLISSSITTRMAVGRECHVFVETPLKCWRGYPPSVEEVPEWPFKPHADTSRRTGRSLPWVLLINTGYNCPLRKTQDGAAALFVSDILGVFFFSFLVIFRSGGCVLRITVTFWVMAHFWGWIDSNWKRKNFIVHTIWKMAAFRLYLRLC